MAASRSVIRKLKAGSTKLSRASGSRVALLGRDAHGVLAQQAQARGQGAVVRW
jgi:hypothetical protein